MTLARDATACSLSRRAAPCKSCHPHQYGASLKTGTKRRDTESLFFIPENACALSAVDSEYRNSDARTRRYRLLAKPSRCSLQVLSSAPRINRDINTMRISVTVIFCLFIVSGGSFTFILGFTPGFFTLA